MDTFLVYDIDDPLDASVCVGEEQTRATVGCFDRAWLKVIRVTVGEVARDVTEDFIKEPDVFAPDIEDHELSLSDRLYQQAKEGM